MINEPLAIAFANTRSSDSRDRIANRHSWFEWIEAHPPLHHTTRWERTTLQVVRRVRDDCQIVLRVLASGEEIPRDVLSRLRLAASRAFKAKPYAVDVLAASALLLRSEVSSADLHACAGANCLRVFTTTRQDRRWCDSTICGNRARVHRHYETNARLRQNARP